MFRQAATLTIVSTLTVVWVNLGTANAQDVNSALQSSAITQISNAGLSYFARQQSIDDPSLAPGQPTLVTPAKRLMNKGGSVDYIASAPNMQQPTSAPNLLGEPAIELNSGSSIDSLFQTAQSNSARLHRTLAKIDDLKGQRQQAGLRPNPTIGYSANEVGNEGRAGQQGVFLGQELESRSKRDLRQSVVDKEIATSQIEYEIQRTKLQTDVRRAFYDVLVLRQRLQVLDELKSQIQKSLDIANKLFEGQEISKVAVLQSRLQIQNLTNTISQAKNQYISSQQNLAALSGIPTHDDPQIQFVTGSYVPTDQELNSAYDISTILASSPEINHSYQMLARNESELSRQRGELFPNVDFQTQVAYDDSTGSTVTNLQIVVPFQIHDRRQGYIHSAKANIQASHELIRQRQQMLFQRFATVSQTYQTAVQQLANYQEFILPSAAEVVELAATGFAEGELDYLQLLTAQRSLLDARLGYLQALQSFWDAKCFLDGNLLAGSLEE